MICQMKELLAKTPNAILPPPAPRDGDVGPAARELTSAGNTRGTREYGQARMNATTKWIVSILVSREESYDSKIFYFRRIL
jgi:hypothetical protein